MVYGIRIKYAGNNKMKLSILIIYLAVLILLLFSQVSCTGKPTESQTGIIIILVVDSDPHETPIPDVEITIAPGNLIKRTDSNGLCSFELDSGEYLVNADVCCNGIDYIHYSESVRLLADETQELKFFGCSGCML